jgi:hypothetical protein
MPFIFVTDSLARAAKYHIGLPGADTARFSSGDDSKSGAVTTDPGGRSGGTPAGGFLAFVDTVSARYDSSMEPSDHERKPSVPPPAMIGLPPSARGLTGRPKDIAEHAREVAHQWRDVGESYVRKRQKELGIPDNMNGEPDYSGDGKWRAFDPRGQQGGGCVTGVVVDSGVLNPELLKGKKGGRIYPKLSLRDRIDAAIAHEYAELHHGSHVEALKAAAKTELPITPGARRLCKAMAR